MENSGWTGPLGGDKVEASTGAADYPGAEGSNSVEGGAEVNYMYTGQPGHNGAGGEGY